MNSTSQNVCCICLEDTKTRGGIPLTSPGCCGKWFHQSCMDEYKAAGNTSCPICRIEFVKTTEPSKQGTSKSWFGNVFRFGALVSNSNSKISSTVSENSKENKIIESSEITSSKKVENEIKEFVNGELIITSTPEYSEIPICNIQPFYVTICLSFPDIQISEQSSNPLDLVCILDNSGSMQGSKIQSLIKAMEFVIQKLTYKDRLSIVFFNSYAGDIHDWLPMTDDNKTKSVNLLKSLRATGGTDIYAGMRHGWSHIQNQNQQKTLKTKTQSCIFLLTDGQDNTNLQEKKQLAHNIKQNGTSFFVFGFGSDHDSAHMNAISDAGEGSFTYIETDDTVIDAFGGAIGTQKGASLKDIELNVSTISENVSIIENLSGVYKSVISNDYKNSTVRFTNLYPGEKREILLKLIIPSIQNPTETYEIIKAFATYTNSSSLLNNNDDNTKKKNNNKHIAQQYRTQETYCTIKRFVGTSLNPLITRNITVDTQVVRLNTMQAIATSLTLGDKNELKKSKRGVRTGKNRVVKLNCI